MSSIANDELQVQSRSPKIGARLWQRLWRRQDSVPEKPDGASKSTRSKTAAKIIRSRSLPNVYPATTPEECQRIAAERLDRLTVFQFSSPACRACARVRPRWDRMAAENPDLDFVRIEVSGRNRGFVVRDLGVPSLPHAGLFHPDAGMVETACVGSSQSFRDFASKVEAYRQDGCQVTYNEENGSVVSPDRAS